ncbi:MAG: ATP-binding cassette domain-containing protein [Clostridioides sp.]|nr:ATP-binding cassette domain-containing protein [Clostridioides sp.]
MEIKIQKRLGDFELNFDYVTKSNRLGICGPSGSGKSMILKSIAGIATPDVGRIADGEKVYFDSESNVNLRPQERRIGYLFQKYALFPTMTAWQNIAVGLKVDREKKKDIVDRIMEEFCISHIKDLRQDKISGGEQQRVALARMMAVEPDIILLDEPFSALDEQLKEHMIGELEKRIEDFKGMVVLVSHNPKEIERLCKESVVISRQG